MNNLRLPLAIKPHTSDWDTISTSYSGFSNQNEFTDFTVSFWMLYKDGSVAGSFIRLDFISESYRLEEDSLYKTNFVVEDSSYASLSSKFLFDRDNSTLFIDKNTILTPWRFLTFQI